MKFNSLFDFKYFLKGVEDKITDEALALRVRTAQGYEIADTDYFMLSDSIASYIGELKHHSKGKTFYKNLTVDELTDANIPNLFAVLTHLSIGLCDRKKVRSSVNVAPFLELRSMVDSMITELLKSGKVENKIQGLLNDKK